MNKYWIRIIFLLALLLSGQAFAQNEWQDLSTDQQKQLKLYAQNWNDIPAARRQRILEGLAHWQEMTPE